MKNFLKGLGQVKRNVFSIQDTTEPNLNGKKNQ